MPESKEVKEAKEAIDNVFSDSGVPAEETASRLKELRDEIETLLDCLRSDGVDC